MPPQITPNHQINQLQIPNQVKNEIINPTIYLVNSVNSHWKLISMTSSIMWFLLLVLKICSFFACLSIVFCGCFILLYIYLGCSSLASNWKLDRFCYLWLTHTFMCLLKIKSQTGTFIFNRRITQSFGTIRNLEIPWCQHPILSYTCRNRIIFDPVKGINNKYF